MEGKTRKNVNYRVEVKPSAEKELLRLSKNDSSVILWRIQSLAEIQRPGGAIKLKAKDFWRIRVGRFRIIYRIEEKQKLIEVVRIMRRREDTYKGL
jgi:mRNA interferase RelE/StbE